MKLLLTALFVLLALPAYAGEAEKDKVLAVLDQFLEGLRTANPALWEPILVPEGTVMVTSKDGGEWKFSTRTLASDIERLPDNEAVIDERYYSPTVMIHETLAVVWAPYSLYAGGEFSHCGIDVFQLLKIEGQWKITQVAYTKEPEGCEDLGVDLGE